jgi:hypothetical protein
MVNVYYIVIFTIISTLTILGIIGLIFGIVSYRKKRSCRICNYSYMIFGRRSWRLDCYLYGRIGSNRKVCRNYDVSGS